MPVPGYKAYNNYSQRDKESMRTAASDVLVTQTDDVESLLGDIKTAAQSSSSDISDIKTLVGQIKTNTDDINQVLEQITVGEGV